MAKEKHIVRVEALVEVELDSRLLLLPPMTRVSDSDNVFDELSKTAKVIEVVKVLPD